MEFREEKEFRLRFSLECSFPEEYDGDEDGYEWLRAWEQRLKPRVVRAVFDAIRSEPGWQAHARNRGVSEQEEIEVVIERRHDAPHAEPL